MLKTLTTCCTLTTLLLHAAFGCAWHAEHSAGGDCGSELCRMSPKVGEGHAASAACCGSRHSAATHESDHSLCDDAVVGNMRPGVGEDSNRGSNHGDGHRLPLCDHGKCSYLPPKPLMRDDPGGAGAVHAGAVHASAMIAAFDSLLLLRPNRFFLDRSPRWSSAAEMRAALQILRV